MCSAQNRNVEGLAVFMKFSIFNFNKYWAKLSQIFSLAECEKCSFGPFLQPKLWNQVPSFDHFAVQNCGEFLCWKYR